MPTRDEKRRMGLVRHGHALLYGWDHGFGMWLPYPIQRLIVGAWNRVTCSTLGHGTLVQEEQGGRVGCTNCCRAVRDPGDGVLRVWEFDFTDDSEGGKG